MFLRIEKFFKIPVEIVAVSILKSLLNLLTQVADVDSLFIVYDCRYVLSSQFRKIVFVRNFLLIHTWDCSKCTTELTKHEINLDAGVDLTDGRGVLLRAENPNEFSINSSYIKQGLNRHFDSELAIRSRSCLDVFPDPGHYNFW